MLRSFWLPGLGFFVLVSAALVYSYTVVRGGELGAVQAKLVQRILVGVGLALTRPEGIVYAAKSLAATAVELLEKPELIAAARTDWQERLKGRKYVSLIPEGQKAPAAIR